MYQKYVKRLLDIIISLVALVVLSPVFLIVAVLVRVKLGSPVIFHQKRPGYQEKIFKGQCWKLGNSYILKMHFQNNNLRSLVRGCGGYLFIAGGSQKWSVAKLLRSSWCWKGGLLH